MWKNNWVVVAIIAALTAVLAVPTGAAKPLAGGLATIEPLAQCLGTPMLQDDSPNAEFVAYGRTRGLGGKPVGGGGIEPTCSTGNGPGCWWAIARRGNNAWPYDYWVYERIDWCSPNGYNISSFQHRAWPSVNNLCYVSWGPVSTHVGGGVGASSVDAEGRAVFTCNAFGWNESDTEWLVLRGYGWGPAQIVGAG